MTSFPPRPIRRNRTTRLPYSGCHRYLMTTKLDRYAECRSIPAAVDEHIQRALQSILPQPLPNQRLQTVERAESFHPSREGRSYKLRFDVANAVSDRPSSV